ncbi:MAG: hypothetical protein EP332_08680 [Bacteroidetes bacterium]|nr:MAG: hypothetical protein EP332_08680 [Bacteroidota bacterium]
MCTLTYIPLESGFLFTSNRDETILRQVNDAPQAEAFFGHTVHFPRDPGAGGTWFASSERGLSLCILNGAFEKHVHKAKYRRSRGLMLLDAFGFSDAHHFAKEYNFEGIEPFTLVWLAHEPRVLIELRWDEQMLHFRELDPTAPEIWSSSTLYSPEVRAERRAWFEQALHEGGFAKQDEILHFHRFTGKGNKQQDLVMQRGEFLRTLSISSLEIKAKAGTLVHQNLTANNELRRTIHYAPR